MSDPVGLPFSEQGAPVCTALAELEEMLHHYPEQQFCLFIGNRTAERWDQSRGRLYMNRVLPGLVYIPVSIQAGEIDTLYSLIESEDRIIAANHTDGYKNNFELRRMLELDEGDPLKVDFVVRDHDRGWKAFNLNSRAFLQFIQEEVGALNQRTVLLLGVGGFGEAIVHELLNAGVERLLLVDPVSKQGLVDSLGREEIVSYHQRLSTALVAGLSGVIVINATGLKDTDSFPELAQFMREVRNRGFIYIDMYPFADLEFVDLAQRNSWEAYNTKKMQDSNDFQMLELICAYLRREDVSFVEFLREVEHARRQLEGG